MILQIPSTDVLEEFFYINLLWSIPNRYSSKMDNSVTFVKNHTDIYYGVK